MVYRKTEAVLAHQEAKRVAILAATLDIIGRHGLAAVTVDLVAARVGGSVGMLYKYFANRDEMIANAMEMLLAADLAAIRKVESDDFTWKQTFVSAIMVFYGRLQKSHLVAARFESPGYYRGICDEVGGIIGHIFEKTPKARAATAAAAILGAIYGVFQHCGPGPRGAETAAWFALRCIGLSNAEARKKVERYSLT